MQVVAWALVVLAGVFFSASGVNEKNVVILTPDPDGRVGQVAVATRGGELLLAQANQMTVVTDAAKAPLPAKIATDEYIDRNFAEALSLQPLPPAKFILYFEPGGTGLDQASATIIPEILAAIILRESLDIGIHGHSDRTGEADKNLDLSLQRANTVEDLLILNGVPEESLEVNSHGEGNPLIPTADGVAEPRNRRVEVIVR